MSHLDPLLASVQNGPFGGQRFYPPGQHPATTRWREYLAALRDVRARAERALAELPPAVIVARGDDFSAPLFSYDTAEHIALREALATNAEAIAYVEERLAAFEAGESEAKAMYLRMLTRDDDR